MQGGQISGEDTFILIIKDKKGDPIGPLFYD